MKKHWAINYVGKEWKIGSRGPDSFDCWGLLYHVYLNEFGIDIGEMLGATDENIQQFKMRLHNESKDNKDWIEVKEPFEGCAVLMAKVRFFTHVGIYLAQDRGKILHAVDGASVIAQPTHDVKTTGFPVLKFYKHRLWQL